ncbi:cation diffusion facilitator family transporter [Aeromicrobium sp. Root495]|uniref:cation diffusion facilitator family transporter n=1 Tax=Aeromicrobium sp. Root495 TaxID=1736550 RepID=UPI0006F75685|nr:cation diffusion facilitator family transporter [Aeromicrobium sp. Root495]KQY55939.1 cation diffusion facilitator family transporter [Aeromicrobium sp. Root495]
MTGHGHDHHHHDHDHRGHQHDHGRPGSGTVWSRLRHGASHLLGAHSHDSADQVDDELEANAEGRRALWTSLGLLALTAALQAFVVVATGSVALLGDTLHNVADALTAVPLLIAFWLARRAPSDRFTYGYGRAEDLAGLFVVAMITLSAVLAGVEAVRRLLDPRDVEHLWAVAAAGVVGFVGNEVVARYRMRVGHRIGSAALVADGLHARTDGFTSLAVVLGAAGVGLGWQAADPVIGLVITVAILGVLRSAAVQVGMRLLDGVDPVVVASARSTLAAVEGVVDVREVRVRWIGHALSLDADLVVPRELSALDAHAIAHAAEASLVAALPRLGQASVHVSPAGVHA